jgi:hypothetical protein
LYVLGVHPLEVMTLIAEASTVHIPTVDRSAAPAPTLTTMWLWGFLPPVLLHDSPIRNVLADVEHRAGMVGERRSQGNSDRHCQGQQRTASTRARIAHVSEGEGG